MNLFLAHLTGEGREGKATVIDFEYEMI